MYRIVLHFISQRKWIFQDVRIVKNNLAKNLKKAEAE